MKPLYRRIAYSLFAVTLAGRLHAGLVHQYKFNETTGTVAADSVGAANGTIGANVTLNQPGRLGSSFKFPATAASDMSRVTLPASVVPGAAFSMTAFFNLAAPLGNGGQMHVISGNNGSVGRWNLGLSDNDTGTGVDPRLFWFHNGGVAGAPVFSTPISNVAGQWVHVGITRDASGKTRLYLNGVGQDIGTSTTALASTTVGIGERPNAAQYQFNGRIDEVRFYDTALTDSEMAAVAAESGDTDLDGLPDTWENLYFGDLSQDGDGDFDHDGFSNRIEFMAGTNPNDSNSIPSGDSDSDGLDDGYEYLNFGNLSQNGGGDFDIDGSYNSEEYLATSGILVTRNPNGSVASTSAFTGSSSSNNADSQPDSDADSLPDGYEYRYFLSLAEAPAGDFDGDGFTNAAEFLANSNPARKGSTPANVHDTHRVAVSDNLGIEEYAVTDGVWTYVRNIVTTTFPVYGITGNSDGYLYATTLTPDFRIIRVNPASGEIATLAARNTGDAATAGWIASDAQGIEIGPDGKIYFSTAFGTPAGEGVFRLNTDGSGFERFISRTGGAAPDDWTLNNARDLLWNGNKLYVSARNSNSVYEFDSAGSFVSLLSAVDGAQGLSLVEDGLLVTGNNAGNKALRIVDPNGVPPVSPTFRADATAPVLQDSINVNEEVYSIAYNTGPGGVGQILRNRTYSPYSAQVVVNALPSLGNDLAQFTSSLVGDPYSTWATANGLDPNSPGGSRTGDFDGDGTTNEVEFALGLAPKDGTSRFAVAIAGTPAAGQTLTWPSQPGIAFEVRSSTDLVDWSTLEATVTGQAEMSTASFDVPAPAGARKFYRVQFEP